MLHQLIANFDNDMAETRAVATSGFILAFNMSFRGPEYMHTEYPDAWREEYESRNYFIGDPVLTWIIAQSGQKRWSEINLPDLRSIMVRSATYGLKYGAVFSSKKNRNRSFLTMSRPDREFTDAEISYFAGKFKNWSSQVGQKAMLTAKEIDVLRLWRDGFGQRDIAEQLGISESTVKQRSAKCEKKLGAKTRTQAVAIAMARGSLD